MAPQRRRRDKQLVVDRPQAVELVGAALGVDTPVNVSVGTPHISTLASTHVSTRVSTLAGRGRRLSVGGHLHLHNAEIDRQHCGASGFRHSCPTL